MWRSTTQKAAIPSSIHQWVHEWCSESIASGGCPSMGWNTAGPRPRARVYRWSRAAMVHAAGWGCHTHQEDSSRGHCHSSCWRLASTGGVGLLGQPC